MMKVLEFTKNNCLQVICETLDNRCSEVNSKVNRFTVIFMNQLPQKEKDQFVSLELTYQKAVEYIEPN